MPSIFTGEEIAVYPRVENVWTHYVCRGTIIISVMIFKKVRIFCSEEKKRYGHPLRMNIACHLHEARVIAHAAVHGDQGIDAGSRAAANRLEAPPQLQLTTATWDKSVSGSVLA